MQLFATKSTKTQSWKVYDDNGRAFIERTGAHPLSWHAVDRTAAEWVAIQSKPETWTFVAPEIKRLAELVSTGSRADFREACRVINSIDDAEAFKLAARFFPGIASHDAHGNFTGSVAHENGWTA